MIEHLQNSPVVWTILTICSLLTIPSLFFAIYTWIKGKEKKEFSPAYLSGFYADNEDINEDVYLSENEKIASNHLSRKLGAEKEYRK